MITRTSRSWRSQVIFGSLVTVVAALPQQLHLTVSNSPKVSHPKALAPAADDALLTVKVSRQHGFVAPIAVGTPPQELRCLLDTGSSDLWVPSRRCEDCEQGHNFFADSSSTFMPKLQRIDFGKPQPEQVEITYGSGQILGFVVEDTMNMGPWQVRNQSFLIVEDEALPGKQAWDGICGLGLAGMSKAGMPLYRNLQDMHQAAIFAFIPEGPGKHSLMLGEVPDENALQSGTLVWIKAEEPPLPPPPGAPDKHTFWMISGGLAIHQKTPKQVRFLVDTGTNQVLLVPAKWYRSFISSLLPDKVFDERCGVDNMAGGMVFCECNLASDTSLLPLRMYFGGREFVIPFAGLLTEVGHDLTDTYSGKQLCLLQVQPNQQTAPLDPFGGLGGILGPFGGIGLVPAGAVPTSQNGAPQPPPGMPLFGPQGSPSGGLPPPGDPAAAGAQPTGEQPMPFPIPLGPGLVGGPGPAASSGGLSAGSAAAGGPVDPLAGLLGAGVPQDGEEEIISEENGRMCKTVIIRQHGQVVKKTTDCENEGRRLQFPPPMLGNPVIAEDPMADIWVLGGVFMERFVTVFDFDQARVGIAEPVGSASSATTQLSRLNSAQRELARQNAAQARGVVTSRGTAGWSLASIIMTLVLVSLVAASVVCYVFIRPVWHRRRWTNREPYDEDSIEEAGE